MKLNREDYVAKVSNASPLQLVIINFELITDNIHEAADCHESGDIDGFLRHINKAREFLSLLMGSLDMSYDISKDLMRIYIYVNGQLIKACFSKSREPACEACELLKKLLESFRTLSDIEADDSPVMENAQRLYAGLTYKNGRLSEFVMEDENRGYRV